MRIGIITLWQSNDNYGQQLQCWALQQVLIKLGHEPYLIRYDIEGRVLNHKKTIWKKILRILLIYPVIKKMRNRKRFEAEKKFLAYNTKKNKERKFEEFRKEHILQSSTIYHSLKELQNTPPSADAYIVGSDQVWAHLLDKDENRAMYLDFGSNEVKRIAYAPSFSMIDYPVHLKERIAENLSRFDGLSVREETGVRICENLGFNAQVVLDPTMLLQKNDYAKISSNDKNDSYVYLYCLNISENNEVMWNELSDFSKKKNLKIIVTTASGYIQGREIFTGAQYQYATVNQWLSLIDRASMVVTTSFHGIVFCIIHHTPFVFFPLKGKYSRGNNRVLDLCSKLGLTDRIWNAFSSFEKLYNFDIEWESVDLKMEKLKNNSYLFLIEKLNEK